MREHLKQVVSERHPLLSLPSVRRGLILLGLALGALAVAPAPSAIGAGASPCTALSGVPCSPIGADNGDAAAVSVRGDSTPGRIVPDHAPAGADRDAAAAEAEAGAAGSSLDSKAANSSFTFYDRNSSGKEIDFKFFSKTRNWVWPSATTYWIAPPDRKQYFVKLICKRGEKVCFGGWWKSNPKVYWGVGQKGDKGCSACCYTCNGGWSAVNFTR